MGVTTTSSPTGAAAPLRDETSDEDDDLHGLERLSIGLKPFHTYSLRWRVLLSHVPLSLTVAVVVLLVKVITGTFFPNELYTWGIAGIAVLTVLAGAVPWDDLPYVSYLCLPILNFVAIGCVVHGIAVQLTGVTLLFVFPVLWLAWSGVAPEVMRVLSFLLPFLAIYAPTFFGWELVQQGATLKYILVPVLTFCLCVAATYVTSEVEGQQAELQRQHDQLRRQQRLLETIVDTAPVGVLVVDEEGHEMIRNRRQQTLRKLSEPQWDSGEPGEGDLLLFSGRERRPLAPERRPVSRAARGERISSERLWLGQDESERAINLSARPLLDGDDFIGSVLVFQDVTELEAALAAQDEFIASISHEFRTPLTSIIGYTDLLIDDVAPDDPFVGDSLAVVQRNAARMLALVDDLLGSSSGVMNITQKVVNLADIARDCAETAAPHALAAGLSIDLELGEGDAVLAERGRLSQAVDNLVSNAIKYTDSGGVVIRTGTRDGWGFIEVEDTGRGMAEQEQERMFDRFYRTESARRTKVPGVGLGMAVVRAIVEGHGGRLQVWSEVDVGTRITLEVPLA